MTQLQLEHKVAAMHRFDTQTSVVTKNIDYNIKCTYIIPIYIQFADVTYIIAWTHNTCSS